MPTLSDPAQNEKLRELSLANASVAEMRAATGLTSKTIRHRLARAGLTYRRCENGPPQTQSQLGSERYARIRELHGQGVLPKDIAHVVRMTDDGVRYALKRMGLSKPYQSPPAVKMPRQRPSGDRWKDPKVVAGLIEANDLSTAISLLEANRTPEYVASWLGWTIPVLTARVRAAMAQPVVGAR